MIQIPFKDFPCFSTEITFDGAPFLLTFSWNTRGEYWTMQIDDIFQNTIIAGIKLVAGIVLNSQYLSESIPAGLFIVQHAANDKDLITYSDFVNEKFVLCFLSEGEY